MEKVIFYKRLLLPSGTFKGNSCSVDELEISNERIKGFSSRITMFEELFTEVEHVNITPWLLGFRVELKPRGRRAYNFNLFELDNLVGVLKSVHINVYYVETKGFHNSLKEFIHPAILQMLLLFLGAVLVLVLGIIINILLR